MVVYDERRMADVVIVGLFTFLLINGLYGGNPGLEEEDATTSTPAPENQLPDRYKMIDTLNSARYKCLNCEHDECSDESRVSVCENAIFCFKSSVRDGDTVLYSKGCSNQIEHYHLTCRAAQNNGVNKRQTGGNHNIKCCFGDLCNDGDFPLLASEADVEPLSTQAWRAGFAVAAALGAVALVGAATVVALRRSHRLRVCRAARKLGPDSHYFSSNVYTPHVTSAYYEGVEGSGGGLKLVSAGDSTLREFLECSVSSGSGSGLPLMVQRTLAKQVSLIECVGKGRYGEVWRGSWYADSVAVKIFFSRDEASWRRETEIFSTVLLRHENIVGYIGSDMTSRNSCTQLWLITHFHPLGSLYEHLSRATLSRHQMMLLLLSTVNGLLHLHTDIYGTQGKPAIAHRDIKSKNILVKSNGECCIADFGLAVTRQHVEKGVGDARQGTKRYMSPELLDQSINLQCFESFRKCDIYSLGLVMWEVCRRVQPSNSHTFAGTPFNGSQFNGTPFNGTPFNGTPFNGTQFNGTPFNGTQFNGTQFNGTPFNGTCINDTTYNDSQFTNPYEGALPPFHDLVPPDPSFDEMRKIVCVDGARPDLPTDTHPTMVAMGALMSECWHANAAVRLPALRIKKTLLKLAQRDNLIRLDEDNEVSV